MKRSVAAKVAVATAATAAQIAAAIDGAEQRIRDAVPVPTVIDLEPDLFDVVRSGDEAPPSTDKQDR